MNKKQNLMGMTTTVIFKSFQMQTKVGKQDMKEIVEIKNQKIRKERQSAHTKTSSASAECERSWYTYK
ncbi:CLUMA_CG004551, isoform A [Clunio marinus]|uniref:CLUMA_CG004551, isoform A n=1 Tax=Clunio marinus TaxID=568069 RepID=A0A1J1HS68_9DIPT|nr:CLUMA_CG004551, isoform A [Clunio marinus]